MTLALVGPFVIIILAFGAAQGGFGWLEDAMVGIRPDMVPVDGSVSTYLFVSGFVAFIGFFVISVESQIIAVAILGGRALGRPITLREALHRSRQVFWRVVGASILVGFLLMIPNLVLSAVLASAFDQASEASNGHRNGRRGSCWRPVRVHRERDRPRRRRAGEAVRRSTRLARALWRWRSRVVGWAVVAYIPAVSLAEPGVDILSRFGAL